SVFDRGNIYFTDKEGTSIAAATIENGFKVAINPSQITDPESAFVALSTVLPLLSRDDFFTKAARKSDPYEEIATKLDKETAEGITNLRISGVTVYRQKWRFYPGSTLAAQAIGFVSYKGDDLIGNYGLEERYNDVLSRTGNNFYVNFFAEIFANVQSTVFKNTTATGDLVTSIEPTVQSQLETVLGGIQTKWRSDTVGGVVMDPYTGEIIAIATSPTFDLNNYGAEKDVGVYINALAQGRYEMGSIVKPLVMAAAIDTGAVTAATSYFDGGSVVVQDKTISNFDKKGRGTVTMQDVLNQSLNTGMVFAQQKMGKEAFKSYMVDKYKLGEKTGVDLPGEVNGLMTGLKASNDVNYANAAFGQGIATTPLNIVRGFAAIANGGTLVTPHVVTAINEQSGFTKKLSYPTSEEKILKPETINTIRTMMMHVVDDGYHRGLKHYSVAAKTGTAQIAREGGQGYYTDRNLHSLIGFFPVDKPRYVLYLFNVYPKGAMYAIQTLGDPFFDMVQFLGNYYAITPDR
ncbi:penicillin-binding protein 2, partial [Patescibacteria group bacterium]|nr:penicillin-binding protein 2 [Patescibacteria group bacterium]